MRVLFIVCAVFGTVGICGLLVMLIFFRLKINLGFKLPKAKTIPIEEFIPQGIYGYSVFVASFGYIGLFLLPLPLPWYFLIPVDLAAALIVNFIGVHFLSPAAKRFINGKAPSPDDLSGQEAIAVDDIDGDGYGKVKVRYNGRSYRFDAISVYHTDIKSGEKLDIVTGEDLLLFVQKKDEIYKVLEEPEVPEAKETKKEEAPAPKRENDRFERSDKKEPADSSEEKPEETAGENITADNGSSTDTDDTKKQAEEQTEEAENGTEQEQTEE